jgi:hypothetical protein
MRPASAFAAALALAADDYAVLDVDAKHPEAHDWYAANRDLLLPTRVHRTRSGGLDLVYGRDETVICSAGKICRGVDVRGDGGYLIWLPAACLPVLCAGPIAPWPVRLIVAAQLDVAETPHGPKFMRHRSPAIGAGTAMDRAPMRLPRGGGAILPNCDQSGRCVPHRVST